MRELKFRAWLNVENKMIQTKNFYGIDYYNGCIWYKKNDKSRGVNLDGVEIMQYTGLKDKNGVEIYEGDIVKITDLDGDTSCTDCGTGYVEYLDVFGFYNVTKIENSIHELAFQDHIIEVIGNIFEDGDLIDS